METRIQIQERRSKTNQLVCPNHRKVIWFRPEWNEIDQMESYWRRSTKKKTAKSGYVLVVQVAQLGKAPLRNTKPFFSFCLDPDTNKIETRATRCKAVVKNSPKIGWSQTKRAFKASTKDSGYKLVQETGHMPLGRGPTRRTKYLEQPKWFSSHGI